MIWYDIKSKINDISNVWGVVYHGGGGARRDKVGGRGLGEGWMPVVYFCFQMEEEKFPVFFSFASWMTN
jgi:hypothetical protein